MELISRDDAIKALRKAILNLMDGLPTTIIDGEECCADNRLCNAYLEANKAVSNALRKIPSWHTDDPEEQMEYIVTLSEKWRDGKTYKFLAILEWVPPLTNDEGDIIEDGEWCFEPWMRESCNDLNVLAWMPLPDKYEEEV